MKLCIVGTGAAGWMAAAYLKKLEFVKEIIIIGSPTIPSIGVGESNTIKLNYFHDDIGINESDFIFKSDASVKYGVYYQNWSKNNFLHNFISTRIFNNFGVSINSFYNSLANKPTDLSINEYVAPNLQETAKNNCVFVEDDIYSRSWHFDAAKYIEFISEFCLIDSKVKQISSTVIDCKFKSNCIDSIILHSGDKIHANYFIFATGNNEFNTNILKQNYIDLSDILLTDKAFVYPLKYTNKRQQFHPYTVAKTMKYGWRWITPTFSRIGTGYVFSSKYISVEQAKKEFINDIGDLSIEPKLVDFQPKYNKQTFNQNYCTLGMANGFLEPLDAPGLTLTINVIEELGKILFQKTLNVDENIVNSLLVSANEQIEYNYKFWASFILTQYKTSSRNDTIFWKDHQKIDYDFQRKIIENMGNLMCQKNMNIMFMHTIAAKDYTWKSDTKSLPYRQFEPLLESVHHLDYINAIRTSVSQFRSIYAMV